MSRGGGGFKPHNDLIKLFWVCHFVNQIPFYSKLCEKMNAGENCKTLVGYSAVYKVCFGMSCFFLLFSLFTIRVNNSKGWRAAVHNG